MSASHSLVAFPQTAAGTQAGTRNRAGWFLTGAVSTVLLVLFVALTAVVLGLLYRDFVVRPVEPTATRAVVGTEPSPAPAPVDEPPGPAAENAPGEQDAEKGSAAEPEPEPSAEPEPEASAEPEPEVAPAPRPDPVRVPVVRPRPAEPVPLPRPGPVQGQPTAKPTPVEIPVPAPVPRPSAAEMGTLNIDAVQRAEVYIAGQFVQYAPVSRQLPPGRYAVSIVAMDGRRRTFEVEITPGVAIRRNWDFDRMEWR